MDGSWGVFVSHEDLPELRNHLIVSVQTKDIIGLQVPPRGLSMLALHQIRNSYAIPIPPSSNRPRYFVGLDVHRDTIVSCVYDSTVRRVCDEREISTKTPKKLSHFVEQPSRIT